MFHFCKLFMDFFSQGIQYFFISADNAVFVLTLPPHLENPYRQPAWYFHPEMIRQITDFSNMHD